MITKVHRILYKHIILGIRLMRSLKHYPWFGINLAEVVDKSLKNPVQC